jgi:hypothetical protein
MGSSADAPRFAQQRHVGRALILEKRCRDYCRRGRSVFGGWPGVEGIMSLVADAVELRAMMAPMADRPPFNRICLLVTLKQLQNSNGNA